MTDYVLTGLVKRRAELAGQIEATHAELRRLVDALENIDQTIRQFDPGHNVEGIRPVEMLVTRALDREDHRLVRLMTKRFGVALRLQKDNGAVRALPRPGQFVLWEVAR